VGVFIETLSTLIAYTSYILVVTDTGNTHYVKRYKTLCHVIHNVQTCKNNRTFWPAMYMYIRPSLI